MQFNYSLVKNVIAGLDFFFFKKLLIWSHSFLNLGILFVLINYYCFNHTYL